MTEVTAVPVSDQLAAHPFDYYYRPGMELRPPPPRKAPAYDWYLMRQRLFSQYMPVLEQPKATPLTRLLDDHYWQGDELMDAVAARGRRMGMAKFRPIFDQALNEGIDKVDNPPEELVALYQQLDRLPDWFDPEAFERGRRVWVNGSPFGKMGGGVLNQVFTTEGEAVSSATGATGRFKRDMARRMLESIQAMTSLSRPDAMDRFSETFKLIVHVRFMHTMVRYGLRKAWGAENFAQCGDPISMTDTVIGSPSFGLINQLIDASFGWKVTLQELEDVNMWWNLHAYRFGVPERIIPRTAMESIELFDHILSCHGSASRWSEELRVCFANYHRDIMVSDSKVGSWLMERVRRFYVGFGLEICGEPLGMRTMSAFGLSDDEMRAQRKFARGVARTLVPVLSILDRRPGRDERWEKNARHGDPRQNAHEKINEAMAFGKGAKSSGFTHHDDSKPSDIALKSA